MPFSVSAEALKGIHEWDVSLNGLLTYRENPGFVVLLRLLHGVGLLENGEKCMAAKVHQTQCQGIA